MDTCKTDVFAAAIAQFDANSAIDAKWGIELGDLVTLRQICVEVIFSRIAIHTTDIAIQSQSHFNGIVDGRFVVHGQCARVTETNGTYLCIG